MELLNKFLITTKLLSCFKLLLLIEQLKKAQKV